MRINREAVSMVKTIFIIRPQSILIIKNTYECA